MFYGEVGIRYLFKGKGDSVNGVVRGYQVLALILVMVGAVLPLTTLWNLVDFSVAFLVFFNVYTLLRMRKYVQYVLKDYTMQVAKGKQPVWDYAVDIKERCR